MLGIGGLSSRRALVSMIILLCTLLLVHKVASEGGEAYTGSSGYRGTGGSIGEDASTRGLRR